MCGIAGLLNMGNPAVLKNMTDILAHRGPDDWGVWNDKRADGGFIGLGSRRLSILDLSDAGHMPMVSRDGNVVIVYNGEVYNHLELRETLLKKGHRFRSGSDTETVLGCYLEYGPDCVHYLNGMFAFAVWDRNRQRLLLARDHFGIKPLYYYCQGDALAFASEFKAFKSVPNISFEIDPGALDRFFTFLWVPEPDTIVKNIRKLPPGHIALYEKGSLSIRQYWSLEIPSRNTVKPVPEEELEEQLRHRFKTTVHSQMLSDVPVGAFLSAGLDSSSIVAMMAKSSSVPVRTFTITFPPGQRTGEITLDDPAVAARTAAVLGCDHQEIVVEPQVADLLPKLVYHMDDPVADPAIIMAFLVSQAAKQTATVLLSGVGGDEIFAGYRKYQAHFYAQKYQRIPGLLRRFVIEPLVKGLPGFRGSRIKGHVRLAKKMARSGSLPPVQRFLTDSVYISESFKAALYSADFWTEKQNFQDPWLNHLQRFQETGQGDFLNRMMAVDISTFMVSLNLNYNDKMTMAASIEGRVPFLDRLFVEWTFENIPSHYKLLHNRPKHILRQAMSGVVPDEVLRQRKAGFGGPVDHWLAHDLKPMMNDLLCESSIRRRGFLQPAAVNKMISEHLNGREDRSLQIWQLLTLELWMRAFLDGT
ncbi:asparagine synthase (glutamine-hydrolyzing) [candidate division KSB1 bacterium]|nr:asparagine synthase (glutamine-hydrolyzing) [candidate division KSB1 bacterium]